MEFDCFIWLPFACRPPYWKKVSIVPFCPLSQQSTPPSSFPLSHQPIHLSFLPPAVCLLSIPHETPRLFLLPPLLNPSVNGPLFLPFCLLHHALQPQSLLPAAVSRIQAPIHPCHSLLHHHPMNFNSGI